MKDATILSLAAIIALVIILVSCLHYGIDHLVVAGVVSVIAGLGGYEIRAWRETK